MTEGDTYATWAALAAMFDADIDHEQWAKEQVALLRDAFSAAAAVAGGLPTLAAYVYGLCQKRWEHSLDHATILRVADTAADVFAETPGDDCEDRQVAGLLLDLGVSLTHCMAAENALNCSCPVDMQRHAAAATSAARAVIDGCGDADTEAYEFLGQAASAQLVYFGALERVAHAVQEFIANREASTDTLREVVTMTVTPEAPTWSMLGAATGWG